MVSGCNFPSKQSIDWHVDVAIFDGESTINISLSKELQLIAMFCSRFILNSSHMDPYGYWHLTNSRLQKQNRWIWAAISRHLQSSSRCLGFPVALEAGAFQNGRLSDMLSPKVMKPLQPRGWRWFMVDVSIVNGFIIIVSLTYIENIRKQLIMICTMLDYNDVGGILTWLSWFLLFTWV